LKTSTSIQNAKKKTTSLETELLAIETELFELEKKYGEFKIQRKGTAV
jgi:hypothetical protein